MSVGTLARGFVRDERRKVSVEGKIAEWMKDSARAKRQQAKCKVERRSKLGGLRLAANNKRGTIWTKEQRMAKR